MVQELRDTNPNPAIPRLIWATTASPSSLAIFRKYFRNVSPDANNCLRPEHSEYENAMRVFLLQGKTDPGAPPMVVKKVTPLSAYSLQENNRIRVILSKHPDNIFQQSGIDETQGDRLIMIGEL